jgi:hypothetical protein
VCTHDASRALHSRRPSKNQKRSLIPQKIELVRALLKGPATRNPKEDSVKFWQSWLALAALFSIASTALAGGKDHTRMTASSSTVRLEDQVTWYDNWEIIDELRDDYDLTHLTASNILNDTNRSAANEDSGIVMLFRDSGKNNKRPYGSEGSFDWKSDDYKATRWYPQGISGSGDAWSDGYEGGKRALTVSWHHEPRSGEIEKGARVSFVDISSLTNVRYRHVLLVEPYRKNGKANFRIANTHAGGIVWYKTFLFVADTYGGIRVFDTARMMRVESDSSKSTIPTRRCFRLEAPYTTAKLPPASFSTSEKPTKTKGCAADLRARLTVNFFLDFDPARPFGIL